MFEIRPTDALIRIDIQTDFCPNGGLPVPGGDEIIEDVNRLSQAFYDARALIVDAQDWHPKGHNSLASSHPGKKPFDVIELAYGTQVLWPDHCIQGSEGAKFHPNLNTDLASVVIRKGMNPAIDSYSICVENDKITPTGFLGVLSNKGIRRLFFVGLAYDFCVGFSALDAQRSGYATFVVKDLTRSIDLDGSVDSIEAEFAKNSVNVINSNEFIL